MKELERRPSGLKQQFVKPSFGSSNPPAACSCLYSTRNGQFAWLAEKYKDNPSDAKDRKPCHILF